MRTAWFIGNRRPVSALVWWRQYLVRFVLWVADWNCGDEIHGNTITFSKDRAIELSSRVGWFKIELPIDSPLPEEAVQFGDNEDQYPLSDQTFIYHQEQITTKPLAEIEEEHSAVKELIRQADRIRHKAQAATASL